MLVAPWISESFGLPWSTLFCLGLLGLFQITIEWFGMLEPISKWDGIGIGWMDL